MKREIVQIHGIPHRAVRIGEGIWLNMTPHDIKLHTVDGEVVTFPPSGQQVRVQEGRKGTFRIPGVPFPVRSRPEPQRVSGLDLYEETPNRYLLVSKYVLDHPDVWGREDIFAPDSGESAVRNDAGKIHSCRELLAAASRVTLLAGDADVRLE